jgi:polyphenol oxidase
MHSTFMPHPDWIVPDWPAPQGVRAVCTTRAGGVSKAPYASLNLGLHVADDPLAVQHNRAVVTQALGHEPAWMQQVHGTQVVELGVEIGLGQESGSQTLVADAACTRSAGPVCTVMVADCLPVFLCSADGAWVGAAHAGWRGLAGNDGFGVLEAIFHHFRPLAGISIASNAINMIAWLGPCIGPAAFEVGADVRAAFVSASAQYPNDSAIHLAAIEACFVPLIQSDAPGAVPSAAQDVNGTKPPKWLVNLPQLARLRLAALGVTQVYGNDGSAPWCTVGNASRFFSHRRDGVSGRMAACIWRE